MPLWPLVFRKTANRPVLPQPNANINDSVRAKCWVRGGVGRLFKRILHSFHRLVLPNANTNGSVKEGQNVGLGEGYEGKHFRHVYLGFSLLGLLLGGILSNHNRCMFCLSSVQCTLCLTQLLDFLP